MILFAFISKYFWLVAIACTAGNLSLFKRRARKYIEENPDLEKGYASLFRGYLLWMNIPWLIMGLGRTVGGVPTVWHYFRPRDGNPFVLIWFGSVLALWIIGTYWLFFKEGAEMLARHPGMLEFSGGFKTLDMTNPASIKTLWLLILAGGIAGFASMWFMETPILVGR
jgi:hypothetical protein